MIKGTCSVRVNPETMFQIAGAVGGDYRYDRYDPLLASWQLLDQIRDQLPDVIWRMLCIKYGFDPE